MGRRNRHERPGRERRSRERLGGLQPRNGLQPRDGLEPRNGLERHGSLEIAIDRIRCDGFGMCAELLPELIELDDWGYPIVAPGPVPGLLVEHARRAVAVCPVLALRLRPVARATMAAAAVKRVATATPGG